MMETSLNAKASNKVDTLAGKGLFETCFIYLFIFLKCWNVLFSFYLWWCFILKHSSAQNPFEENSLWTFT